MALEGRDEKSTNKAPKQIQELFSITARYQVVKNYWNDWFEQAKEQLVKAAQALPDTEMKMKVGKAFVLDNGTVTPSTRGKYSYKIAEMWAHIQKNKIPAENFLACIKEDGLDIDKVKTLFGAADNKNAPLPDCYKKIDGEVFFVVKASPDFAANVTLEVEAEQELLEKLKEEKAAKEAKVKKKAAA